MRYPHLANYPRTSVFFFRIQKPKVTNEDIVVGLVVSWCALPFLEIFEPSDLEVFYIGGDRDGGRNNHNLGTYSENK